MVDSPADLNSDAILQKYRPVTRHKTTYGNMNDWWRTREKMGQTGIPATQTDTSWKHVNTQPLDPWIVPPRPVDYEEKFRRSFSDLSSQIAYRYPNPGLPRIRQGRVGGSWRHIKEVLGHGGSRVVFVDGLVSLYDTENFNQHLNEHGPQRPHLRTPMYSHFSRHSSGLGQHLHESDKTWSTTQSFQQPPGEQRRGVSFRDPDVERKLNLQSSNKYKGFYRYNK